MSREVWQGILRKRILKRAETIHVEAKLSAEVEAELKDLYRMEKEA